MTPAEALRAVCDAWERGDPDAAANLFAPDGVYEDPLYEAPLHGRERLHLAIVGQPAAADHAGVTLNSGERRSQLARHRAEEFVVRVRGGLGVGTCPLQVGRRAACGARR